MASGRVPMTMSILTGCATVDVGRAPCPAAEDEMGSDPLY